MAQQFRILSFDGGGIRGYLSARLLERIQDEPLLKGQPGSAPLRLLESVDCFAGTSTGALIAVALAAGKTPNDVCQLYSKHAETIFRKIRSLPLARHVAGPVYCQKGLDAVLSPMFGDLKLGELPHKVVVVALGMNHAGHPKSPLEPRIYHNFDGSPHADRRVIEVLLESCAAPTYFRRAHDAIDGGMIANNPIAAAIAHVISHELGTIRPRDVVALSIGTGLGPRDTPDLRDASSFRWMTAGELVSTMIDGGVELVSRQAARILPANTYHRVQPTLSRKIDLDDIDSMEELLAIAAGYDLDQPSGALGTHRNVTGTRTFVLERFLKPTHVPASVPVTPTIRALAITQILLPGEVSVEHRAYSGVTADDQTKFPISARVSDVPEAKLLEAPALERVSDPRLKLDVQQRKNDFFRAFVKFPERGVYGFSLKSSTLGAYPSTASRWRTRFPDVPEPIDSKSFEARLPYEEFTFKCIFSDAYRLDGLPRCTLTRSGVISDLSKMEWDPYRSEVQLRDVRPGDLVKIEWTLRDPTPAETAGENPVLGALRDAAMSRG